MSTPLSVEKSLAGRHILFTGASGFLGKVWLSHDARQGARRRAHLRAAARQEGPGRACSASSACSTSRTRSSRCTIGTARSCRSFLAERIEVIGGDVSLPGLGVEPKLAAAHPEAARPGGALRGPGRLQPRAAARRSSDNVEGTIHAAEFAAKAPGARLRAGLHLLRGGQPRGAHPRAGHRPTTRRCAPGFDVEAEYRTSSSWSLDIHEQCTGEKALAELRDEVVKSITEKGHDPNNHQLIDRIMRREEKARLTDRLVEDGKARAQHWGWPNVYTFTKSMAESMLLARFPEPAQDVLSPRHHRERRRVSHAGLERGAQHVGTARLLHGHLVPPPACAQGQAARRGACRLLLRGADRCLGGAGGGPRRSLPTSAPPATATR